MDTQSSFQAKCRNKKSLKIGDGPETRETDLDVLPLRETSDKGARKRRERGRARHAAQTASERQATHSGKVPMNAELSPLRREKQGMEVQRYGTLNEAMKL